MNERLSEQLENKPRGLGCTDVVMPQFAEEAAAIAECLGALARLSGGLLACHRVVRVLHEAVAGQAADAIIARTAELVACDKAVMTCRENLAKLKTEARESTA